MTTVTGSDLGLGVIFTGKVDEAFNRAVNRLRTAITGLANIQNLAAASLSTMSHSSNESSKAARKQADEYSILGKKIGQVHGGFQRLTQAMQVTASYGLASTVLFGFVTALKQGVQAIAEYDQSLKDLKAITNSTDAEIGALSNAIKKVVASTKFSAKEVADAALLIGQAGYSAAETSQILGSVALLSTGTLEDMASAADLVTSALSVFEIKATESARVADIFANAANYSKLTIDKMRTAFNYFGPIASKAGYSLENTAAMMMVMANAGLKASTIGTGLRQVIARLIDPNEKLQRAFKAAGVDMEKLNPKTASLVDIFKEFRKVVPDATRAYQLFGMLGASAASVISSTSLPALEELVKKVYEAGSINRMASTQMEGLSAMAKNLVDKLGLLAIAIGDGGVAGAFKLVLNVARPFLDILTSFTNTWLGKVTVAFLSMGAAIGTVTLALRYLTVQMAALAFGVHIATIKTAVKHMGYWAIAIDGATTAFKKLWAIVGLNPFSKWLTIVSLAGAAIYAFINHIRMSSQKLQEHVIELAKTIDLLETYRKKLSESKEGSEEYRATLQRLAEDFPELADSLDTVNGKLRDNGKALDELTNNKRSEQIKGLITQIRDYRAQAFLAKEATELWAAAQSTLHIPKGVSDFLKNIFSDVGSSFNVPKKYAEAQQAFTKLIQSIQDGMSDPSLDTTEISAKVDELAQKLKDGGLKITASELEISQELAKNWDSRSGNLEKTAKQIKIIYDGINKQQEVTKASVQSNATILGQSFKQIGGDWYSTFEKLQKKNDWAGIYDLSKALKQADLDFEALKKDILSEGSDFQQGSDAANKAEAQKKTQFYAQRLEEVQKSLNKEEAANEKLLNTLDVQLDKHIANQEGKLAEIETARAKDIDKAKGRADIIAKINGYYDEERKQRLQDIANIIEQNTAEEIGATQGKIAQLQYEIALLKKKREEIEGGPLQGEDKKAALSTASIQILSKEQELEEKQYSVKLINVAKFSEEYSVIMAQMRDKNLLSEAEYLQYLLALQERQMDIVTEGYQRKLISGEEYYRKLKELNERTGRLTPQQLDDERITATGSLGGRFQLGVDRAKAKIKDLSELMIDIGEQLPEQISSNLTDSLFDIADGANSAKEAFKDFAKNTLRWLAELIGKQELYNAAVNASGLVKQGVSWVGSAISGLVGSGSTALAEGGWITEPVIGKGLRTGRQYTIAENEAEYVSPGGKMRAIQSQAPNVTVNVINKTGANVDAKQEGALRLDGDRWVMSVVLNALNTNKNGFKSTMSAALSR